MHVVLDMHVHGVHLFVPMKLADWMLKSGVGDEVMASRLEVDRTTLSRLRRGITRPSWDLVNRISEITSGEVTANDFMNSPEEASEAVEART